MLSVLCVFAIVMGKWLAWEGLQLFGPAFLPIVLVSGSLPWVASGFCCLADVVWCVCLVCRLVCLSSVQACAENGCNSRLSLVWMCNASLVQYCMGHFG